MVVWVEERTGAREHVLDGGLHSDLQFTQSLVDISILSRTAISKCSSIAKRRPRRLTMWKKKERKYYSQIATNNRTNENTTSSILKMHVYAGDLARPRTVGYYDPFSTPYTEADRVAIYHFLPRSRR